MNKRIVSLLGAVLVVSLLAVPTQTASAQISIPADINKTFTPISIAPGGTSLMRVTVFNPNTFPLTSASWTDNMPSNIKVVNIDSNSCRGSVTATAGSSTVSLNGGTVPPQAEGTPGSCTVAINVTSTTPGNWVNIIPARELRASGPGNISITNTSAARVTLLVTGTGGPTVSKSFSPNNIWAGGTSRLSIVIANNTNTTLTGVSIRDDLPTNVSLADPVSPTQSAGCGGGSLTAVAGGTFVTWTNGTINAGATCTITVNVTGDIQGGYTNRIPAQSLENDQNLTNATDATARLNIREIGLTKRFTPPTVPAGGTTTLIITLQNPRNTDYTGVNVTDNLPPELNVNGTVTSTCIPPGTISNTATSVTLSNGRIPAGSPSAPGTCTITVPVIALGGTPSGTYTNTIPRGQLTTDQGVGNLTAANATVRISGSDVTGIKSFSPSSIPVGGNSRLRIDIFAPSDTSLTNFSITDTLPTGIIISNSTQPTIDNCGPSPQLTADTGTSLIILTNGEIAAGQRCRIEVFVTSNSPTPPDTPYTNTIPPTNITNNENRVPTNALTADLTVTSSSIVSMGLNKGFDPPQVFGGAASTMSIKLTNPGTVTLTNITFTDTMPNGMILANPVNFNVGTCSGTLSGAPGDSSFVFSGGTLPPLSDCILTLSATMTVNGNLVNTIRAGAVTTDNGVSNVDPAEATLTNQPGASISKFFSPNPIPVDSYSLLTITILNTGNIELVGMGLSDSLPTGLVVASGSAPAPVNNCGGTFTAVPGTQLVELSNGSLIGNSSCTILVAVTASTAGNYLNTIPEGNLRTDPSVGVTNLLPAIDTLVVTSETVARGGGGGRGNNNRPGTSVTGTALLIPVTAGFTPGIVTKLDDFSRRAYDATDLRIEIPVIKVSTPIVGVESKKGNWDISWLQDQVGWLNGTAYPTWNGNSVLTAHVVNADGKPGVFSRLKSLGVGEYIFVHNSGYRYTYQVLSNTFIQPDDGRVMKHEEKSHLTLITCDTYDEKTGKYLRYVMVRAVLVDTRPTK